MSGTPPDPKHAKMYAAMAACITSARNLLESAKAVFAIGKHNIAYHLATAALEELGKRELYGLQSITSQETVPPTWPQKHSQEHVQKLFWCFFGPQFFDSLSKKGIEDIQHLARIVHEKRLDGLYVENSDKGLSEPHNAVSKEDADNIIKLVEAQIEIAAAQKPKTPKPEELAEQAWFLRTASDPRTSRFVMSKSSLDKLAELKSVQAWVRWMQGEFAKAEAEGMAAMQAEMQRSKSLPASKEKDKWKVRMRIFSDSHIIRPGVLTAWNSKSDWIKLVPVNGKKNQLILELILGDNIPVEGLWFFAWGVARHFVTALNIGSMGFWWWRMPEQVSRFYDTIEDLETHRELGLERNPGLKVDWGENRVLTEDDLVRVATVFAALPGPRRLDKHGAYNFYIGGITFMSLNDVHWQCEIQAFGNFYESLKAMMKDTGDWDGTSPFEVPMLKFLDEMFPGMEERDRFSELCKTFDARTAQSGAVTLKETSFIKLFCDAYFLRRVRPSALKDVDLERLKGEDGNKS